MEQLQRQIDELKRRLDDQSHDGNQGRQISFRDLVDFVPTVSAAPTTAPRIVSDQFRIYTNGVVYRFYWYDFTAGAWHYILATA